jgi:hypothetical protein
MTYDQMINDLFYLCIEILVVMGKELGMTYEEINIWFFVILHPLVTIGLLVMLWVQRSMHYSTLRRMLLKNA